MEKLPKIYEPILLDDITSAVREADEGFKKTGGSSRHWVDDWFLECLAKRGLQIFKAQAVYELEAERDAARKERNEYFAERNRACERASALMVERDALKAELSDCKADLAAYEAQRPDDDTFSLLAASYERKISQLEAENEKLNKFQED